MATESRHFGLKRVQASEVWWPSGEADAWPQAANTVASRCEGWARNPNHKAGQTESRGSSRVAVAFSSGSPCTSGLWWWRQWTKSRPRNREKNPGTAGEWAPREATQDQSPVDNKQEASTGEPGADGGSVGGHGSSQLINLPLWGKELLQLTESQAHKTSTKSSGLQGESHAYLQFGGKHLAISADLQTSMSLWCTMERAYSYYCITSRGYLCTQGFTFSLLMS